MKEHFHGLIAAPFTPMRGDGSVNLDAVAEYASFLARNGVSGAYVCGTTGESMSLTVNERRRIAERWIESAPPELTVIVHVGHTCLRDAAEMARHAQRCGAHGIGAMPPCFFRPGTVDDLVTVCREIAAAAPELPFYYYHIPEMTGVRLPMCEFLRAAAERVPTLAGLKFTSDDLDDYERCLGVSGGELDVLFGRDEMLIRALERGARGAVGSTYNFAAPLYSELMDRFQSGDREGAEELQRSSQDVVALCRSVDASFNAAAKRVMAMLGMDCGPVRLPLRNLTDAQGRQLRDGLEKMDFFDWCCRK